MCGGSLKINESESIATCEYCGTKQTLPNLDTEIKVNLYDRANHFRRNNEYDKASLIYEQILNQDNLDAEAYWSLVLCRYGIEYVEDPLTKKRIPTINRTQFTSIYADENFKSALKYADSYQSILYEEEAKKIDDIQKNILSISQNESPFDVFICYKETDNQGKRTIDSVLANDLYHQLIQEEFKVFYAKITLEDKLGSAYEPYIFAALNSAKVMIVLGTKPEYFKSTWVKNEWSRYLGLIKNGSKKMLIPAYKEMDPYELPEEFSHLQALDMSKLGFMQDLIRGIKKIVLSDKQTEISKEAGLNNNEVNQIDVKLERILLFLEDREWDKVDEFSEQILNQDPKNAQVYLYKLMRDLRVKKIEDLENLEETFENNKNYQKYIRFADEKQTGIIQKYIQTINDRNEYNRLNNVYNSAVNSMNNRNYPKAINLFDTIIDYKDSIDLKKECEKKEQENKSNKTYEYANQLLQNKKDIFRLEQAKKEFESILEWKDAKDKAQHCQKIIDEVKSKKAQNNKKIKKVLWILVPFLTIIITFLLLQATVFIPHAKYTQANKLKIAEEYEEAIEIFEDLGTYKDSYSLLLDTKYDYGLQLISNENYQKALAILFSINHKDSNILAQQILDEHADQILRVNIGGYTSAAITSTNHILVWGNNAYGQLGDDTTIDRFTPQDITDQFYLNFNEEITSIVLGPTHSAAITSDGRIFTWGKNDLGQLGDGTQINKKIPTDITAKFNLEAEERIISVVLGYSHSAAISSTGRVFTWGDNSSNKLGYETGTYQVEPLDITEEFSLEAEEKIISVALGYFHSAALSSTGRLFTWGSNASGQLGNPMYITKSKPAVINSYFDLTPEEKIISVSLGTRHSAAITSIGRMFTWGDNTYGKLGDGTATIKNIPTDITAGFNLSEGEKIVSTSLGASHSAAITSLRRIFTWGSNSEGRLGNGTRNDSDIPIDITRNFNLSVGEKIYFIALGAEHSAAISSLGQIYAWGYNEDGQMGDSSSIFKPNPYKVFYNFFE
jgi:alpha-tubulin suppressor-like RCC1 family protein